MINIQIRHIIQLTRAHTVGLTVGFLLISVSLTNGTLWNYKAGIIALVGAMMHLGGFALNEYADREHDKRAPYKRNVISDGTVSSESARRLILALCSLSVITAAIVTARLVSWILFILAAISGVIYNAMSKRHLPAKMALPLWALFLFLWASSIFTTTTEAVVMSIFFAVMLGVQILEGEWKDRGESGANMLNYISDRSFIRITHGLNLAGWIIIIAQISPQIWVIPGIILGAWSHRPLMGLCSGKPRKTMLRGFALHEMIFYTLALLPMLAQGQYASTMILLFAPIAIFVVLTKMGYGQTGAPGI